MAQRYEMTDMVFRNAGSAIVALAGASVTVKDTAGTNLTVYQAETGGSTFSNPLTTDSNGRIEGWVEDPNFDMVVSGTGITTYTQKVRLKSSTHIKQLSAGAGMSALEILPETSGKGPFRIGMTSDTFNGTRDHAMVYGYNIGPNGVSRVESGEPQLKLGLESDYNNGADHFMEWNLDYVSAAGVLKRYMGFEISRTSGDSGWSFVAQGAAGFRIERVANDNSIYFRPSASGFKAAVKFASGAESTFQIGGDGSATAPDLMSIGPSCQVDYKGIALREDGPIGLGLEPQPRGGSGTMLQVGNVTAAPTDNPTGGGILYVESGALKYRGSSGTVTTVANA